MTENEIFEKLVELIQDKVKDKEITPSVNLMDLGLDSLDKADIMITLEDEYDISFNEDEMMNVATIGDLQKIILEKVNK